jgi:phosphonopyruvate decarboxylase
VPLDPQVLYAALLAAGIREFAGVPCSILNHLILEAEASPEVSYLPASVEGEAVAAAVGAWLGGSLGAVLLQNSGLGNAINPLASLAIPYRIPLLLISSWRGEPGRKDAAQHLPMGRATPGLFELLDIPATVLREGMDLAACAKESVARIEAERRPAALIVPRGVFGPGAEAPADAAAAPGPAVASGPEEVARFPGRRLPSRSQVLAALLERCGEFAAISTTGYMSRELAARGNGERHFPMQGSMGFALAIALGISRAQAERPLFVVDGDGALIMRLGSLATVGADRPRHLVHLAIDNGTYASTGGQRTASKSVDFARVALACGYRGAARCEGREGLPEALAWARAAAVEGSGPALLHVPIDRTEAAGLERPARTPPEIAEGFRRWMLASAP